MGKPMVTLRTGYRMGVLGFGGYGPVMYTTSVVLGIDRTALGEAISSQMQRDIIPASRVQSLR